MNKDQVTSAADFMWRNARLVERLEFAHRFLGEGPDPAVRAVLAYQNDDGGFGNALESDIRGPRSQPVPVEVALRKLEALDALEPSVADRACGFLATIANDDGGIAFVLPTVTDYPRAPWWEPSDGNPSSLNPTAALVGVLRTAAATHEWLDRAERYCWAAIEEWKGDDFYSAKSVLTFLERAADRARAERELDRLGQALVDSGTLRLEGPAGGFAHGENASVLGFAPLPTSAMRRVIPDAVVAKHLDAVAAAQAADGGWETNWPDTSPAAALEWRGCLTLEALTILEANGRLE